MRHLYQTRAEVHRLKVSMHDGAPLHSWSKVDEMFDPMLNRVGELMCRLDLQFLRPGKDQPMPIVAGRAPDRVGLMFCDFTRKLKSGDRIVCLDGPISGTFEMRVVPDAALDYGGAHHLEVQVIEVSQALKGIYPGHRAT